MKDLGKLTFFLGLQITYQDNGDLFISQSKYVKDLLKKARMESCKSCPTPCKPHTQLLKDEGTPLIDPKMFRSLVETLQYLTFTRPDIAFVVNYACQFMATPTDAHYYLMKRILRYLQGTTKCDLTYSASTKLELSAFSDADWASDVNTRRSTTRYVVFLGNNPVSWQLKKQGGVSRNSTEAEYKALANAVVDVAWIRLILKDLKMFLPLPHLLHCDNISCIALCLILVFHTCIKKGTCRLLTFLLQNKLLTFLPNDFMVLPSFIIVPITSWGSPVEIESGGIKCIHAKWHNLCNDKRHHPSD